MGTGPSLSLAAQAPAKSHRDFLWGPHLAGGSLRLLNRTHVPSWPQHQKIVTLPSTGTAKTRRHPGAAALPAPSRPPQPWDGDSGRLPLLNHPRASRRPESPVCPSWERCIPAERGWLGAARPGCPHPPGRGQQHSRASPHRGGCTGTSARPAPPRQQLHPGGAMQTRPSPCSRHPHRGSVAGAERRLHLAGQGGCAFHVLRDFNVFLLRVKTGLGGSGEEQQNGKREKEKRF